MTNIASTNVNDNLGNITSDNEADTVPKAIPVDNTSDNPENLKPTGIVKTFQEAAGYGVNSPDMQRLHNTDAPSFGSTVLAQITNSNLTKEAYHHVTDLGLMLSEDDRKKFFEPTEKETNTDYIKQAVDQGYGDYVKQFADANTDAMYERIKERVIQQQQAQQVVNDAGLTKGLSAGLVAGLTDPVSLAMFGAFAPEGLATKTLWQAVGDTALAGAGAQTVSEALMKQFRPDRTLGESVENIGAATILGGLFGAAGKGVSEYLAPKLAKAAEGIDTYRNTPDLQPINDSDAAITDFSNKSIGAAESPKAPENYSQVILPEGYIKSKAFQASMDVTSKVSPKVALMNSPFDTSRTLVEKLVRSDLATEKNAEGIASEIPVWNEVRTVESDLYQAHKGTDDQYAAYRKDTAIPDKLGKEDFENQVGLAGFNDDKSDNPYVAKAAQAVREKFMAKYEAEALDSGVLDKLQTSDPSYMLRIWNKNKIIADRENFSAMIRDDLQSQFNAEKFNTEQAILKLTGKTDEESIKKLADLQIQKYAFDRIANSEPNSEYGINTYLKDSVDKTVNQLTTKDFMNNLYRITPNDRGPLKERTFNVASNRYKDYLITNSRVLTERYQRTVIPEIYLQKKFGYTNLVTSGEGKSEIIRELEAERNAKFKSAQTEEERLSIDKQYQRDVENIAQIWDQTRGTYRSDNKTSDDIVKRGLAAIRMGTVLTKMGGVTLSSIGDPLNIANAHGWARTLKGSMALTLNRDLANVNRQQVYRVAKGLNYELNSRLRNMHDLGDPYASPSTAFERGLSWLTRQSANISLINQWTDIGERLSTFVNSQRIIENAIERASGKTLTKDEDVWMKQIGISDQLESKMLEQFNKYGKEYEDGSKVFNTQDWSDQRAAKAVESILNANVSSEIVVRAPGDLPKAAENDWVKTFTLGLSSYNFAAQSKLLLSTMQKNDRSFLLANANFMIMGAAIYAMKLFLTGQKIPDDNAKLFYGTLQNNQLIGLPMMAYNYAEAAGVPFAAKKLAEKAGYNLDPNNDAKAPTLDNGLKTIGGPGYDTITNLANATSLLARLSSNTSITTSQIHNARKALPFQNHFVMRRLFDKAEEGLANQTNATDNRRPQ